MILALLLIAPSTEIALPSPAPLPTEEEAPFEVGPHSFDTASDDFSARMLTAHNALRSKLGLRPLLWDSNLAAAALAHAQHMAITGRFEHAPASGQGENLWMGSAGHYSVEAMVQMWSDEAVHFRKGRFPSVSETGNWADIGHFTQMIWPTTTHVGCAAVRGASDDYLVCRYTPPGNVLGQKIG